MKDVVLAERAPEHRGLPVVIRITLGGVVPENMQRLVKGYMSANESADCGSAPKRHPALMRRRRLKVLKKVIFFGVRSAPVGTPLSLGFQNNWRCLARKSWGPASAPIHIESQRDAIGWSA